MTKEIENLIKKLPKERRRKYRLRLKKRQEKLEAREMEKMQLELGKKQVSLNEEQNKALSGTLKVKVTNLKEPTKPAKFPKTIKVSNHPKPAKYPKKMEVKVLNLQEVMAISNFPASMKVSNLKEIRIPEVDFDLIKDAEDPVAVRLSDGKKFIDKLVQVVGGAQRSGLLPFTTSLTAGGIETRALVDLQGHQQIDIVAGNSIASKIGGSVWVSGQHNVIRQDASTEALTTTEYEHHEIHDENSFTHTGVTILGSGDVIDLIVVTGNTTRWAHFVKDIAGSAETNYCMYEGVSLPTAGISLDTWNRNRNSSKLTNTHIKLGTSVTNLTTPLDEHHFGSDRKVGGERRDISEWELKQDTIYLIRVTSEAASNDLNWQFDWYEHQDKH